MRAATICAALRELLALRNDGKPGERAARRNSIRFMLHLLRRKTH